jgi:hypothetical protein
MRRSLIKMASLIRIPRPDDWHLHVRDGEAMAALMRGESQLNERGEGRGIPAPPSS